MTEEPRTQPAGTAGEPAPMRIEHRHGLNEWSPMLPERSAEPVVLETDPQDRLYRCQRVGCTEVVRIEGGNREEIVTS